jgi:hypothetical protein
MEAQWLLDIGFPRIKSRILDVVYATDINRTPGPVGLKKTSELNRTLITKDYNFRGSWDIGISHPGIVIMENRVLAAEALIRNLRHLELCLKNNQLHLKDQRFFIQIDKYIIHIDNTGTEHDLEKWKSPRVTQWNGINVSRFSEVQK